MQLYSDQINEIATALSKAQSVMEVPKKDKKNPHFKNEYASLGSILTACKKALNEHGLTITQQLVEQGEAIVLVTSLIHSSGQWIRSCLPLRIDAKATAQQMGSALTYAKRYSITSILCMDADEDDDGAIASLAVKPVALKTVLQRPSHDEISILLELIGNEVDIAAFKDKCKNLFKSEDLTAMSREYYERCKAYALDKIKEVGVKCA